MAHQFGRDRLWIYHEQTTNGSEWVECKILHEFLEKYQIIYYSKNTASNIELVVDRNNVREVESNGRHDSGGLFSKV